MSNEAIPGRTGASSAGCGLLLSSPHYESGEEALAISTGEGDATSLTQKLRRRSDRAVDYGVVTRQSIGLSSLQSSVPRPVS